MQRFRHEIAYVSSEISRPSSIPTSMHFMSNIPSEVRAEATGSFPNKKCRQSFTEDSGLSNSFHSTTFIVSVCSKLDRGFPGVGAIDHGSHLFARTISCDRYLLSDGSTLVVHFKNKGSWSFLRSWLLGKPSQAYIGNTVLILLGMAGHDQLH